MAQIVVLQHRQPGLSNSSGSSGGGSSSALAGQKRGRGARGAVQRERQPEELGDGDCGQALPTLAVANIHVLFNPRRGDIKLAQVGGRGRDRGGKPARRLAGSLAGSGAEEVGGQLVVYTS